MRATPRLLVACESCLTGGVGPKPNGNELRLGDEKKAEAGSKSLSINIKSVKKVRLEEGKKQPGGNSGRPLGRKFPPLT